MKKKVLYNFFIVLIMNFLFAVNAYAQRPDETSSKIEKILKREEEKPPKVFERAGIGYNSQGARDPFKGLIQQEESFGPAVSREEKEYLRKGLYKGPRQ